GDEIEQGGLPGRIGSGGAGDGPPPRLQGRVPDRWEARDALPVPPLRQKIQGSGSPASCRLHRRLGQRPWGRKTIIRAMAAPKKSIRYWAKSRRTSGRTIMAAEPTRTPGDRKRAE